RLNANRCLNAQHAGQRVLGDAVSRLCSGAIYTQMAPEHKRLAAWRKTRWPACCALRPRWALTRRKMYWGASSMRYDRRLSAAGIALRFIPMIIESIAVGR